MRGSEVGGRKSEVVSESPRNFSSNSTVVSHPSNNPPRTILESRWSLYPLQIIPLQLVFYVKVAYTPFTRGTSVCLYYAGVERKYARFNSPFSAFPNKATSIIPLVKGDIGKHRSKEKTVRGIRSPHLRRNRNNADLKPVETRIDQKIYAYHFETMYHLPYEQDLKEFSRQLRNNSTRGEILLWMELRAGQVMGYGFNRQKPLSRYIVDFYSRNLMLVIEVDGAYHFFPEQRVKDEERQQILEKMGLHFLRFTEREVIEDREEVLIEIEHYIRQFEKAYPELKRLGRYR